MGATAEKLTYLNTTKQNLKTVINTTGAGLTDESTFRSYANVLNDKILGAINGDVDLFEEYPKVSGNGTDLSLNGVVEGKMSITPQGGSSQDGEPTPTTPIPVKSVTGENSLVLQNENLFKSENYLYDVTISAEGKIVGGTQNNLYYIPVSYGNSYRISYENTASSNMVYGFCGSMPSTGTDCTYNLSNTNALKNITFTPSQNDKYLCIRINRSNQLPYISNITFVKGSTAPTTYVEHEEQNYQLSFGNIELNSTPDGTIRDQIVGSPNNWVKREWISKVITNLSNFNPAGAFDTMKTNGNLARYRSDNTMAMLSDRSQIYCNQLKGTNNSTWNGVSAGIQVGTTASEVYLAVPYDIIEEYYGSELTSNNWRTAMINYFTEKPLIYYYPRAQYTDVPITDTTLINQLNDIYNNAHSYNGVTNITTTYEDGNEQMYLDIEALKNVWDTSL